VDVCPTHSIVETNFPPKKEKKPEIKEATQVSIKTEADA
jgi:hypothetical protein